MAYQDTSQDSSSEMDEYWALFAQESEESLELAEASLLALEADPGDSAQIAALFRAMHTFKGLCRTMGLSVIEVLGHHAEDLVGLVRDEGVALSGPMIDLLLGVLDLSRAMLPQVIATRQDVAPADVAEMESRLTSMVAEKEAEGPPGLAAQTEPPPPAEQVEGADRVEVGEIGQPGDLPPAANPAPREEAALFETFNVAEVELIDPATDPTYVTIFLEMAQDEIGHLHPAMERLEAGDETALETIRVVAEALEHAATHMGYDRLIAALTELTEASNLSEAEARRVALKRAELAMFEALMIIQESAGLTHDSLTQSGPDFAWLFRRWHAERVFADLARLSQHVDLFEQLGGQALTSSAYSQQRNLILEEVTYLLRAIYHSCVFYKLEAAAHLTLALSDLYGRIAQREMNFSDPLLSLTHTYVTHLSSVIQDLQEGEPTDNETFKQLIEIAEKVLFLNTDPLSNQLSLEVLDLLDLPAQFREVITPENLVEIGTALQAGEHFYTILADLDQDETVAMAFLEWSQRPGKRVITSITLYQNNRSLFDFLVATPQDELSLQQTLAQLDPHGQCLTCKACLLREGIDPAQIENQPPAERKPTRPTEQSRPTAESTVNSDSLADFMSVLGKLMTSHATLQRVTARLTNNDPSTLIARLLQRGGDNQPQLHQRVEQALLDWSADLQILIKSESEMDSALGQLHDIALHLRVKPIAEILTPLPDLVQETAQHQNKLVELKIIGSDTEVDQNTLANLANPIRMLVWLAINDGIELPQQRLEAGKSATGSITINIKKRQDQIQVVIEDDGRGVAESERFSLNLSAEATNLATVRAELAAHQGRLTINRQPGHGSRCTIDFPMGMVVLDGLVVRAGLIRYVVPIGAVNRIIKTEREQIINASADGGHTLLKLEEQLIPIRALTHELAAETDQNGLMLVVERAEENIAYPISELIGQQQVLTQPLQGHLVGIQGVSGCALLGDGEVGMILDLA